VEEECGGLLGFFEDLEVIRTESGMLTSGFCERFEMPERTWRCWQVKARASRPPKGAVAAARARCCPESRSEARQGSSGVGASEGLGDDLS